MYIPQIRIREPIITEGDLRTALKRRRISRSDLSIICITGVKENVADIC